MPAPDPRPPGARRIERDPAAAAFRVARAPGAGGPLPPHLDPATAPLRRRYLTELAAWLEAHRDPGRTNRLLDLGCGDLVLAALLDGWATVDGHDPDPRAWPAARAAVGGLALGGELFERLDDVPAGAYDGVVIGSVVQYLPTADAVADLLASATRFLRADAAIGVVATDARAEGSSPLADLRDLLAATVARGGWVGGVHAALAGLRSGREAPRYRVTTEGLVQASATRGVAVVRLPRNLGVFGRRASYLARPATRAVADAGDPGWEA